MNKTIALEKQYCAPNYTPLPVVLTRGQGIHVWDDAGKQYIDMMSAYSAVSCGHAHPAILKTLNEQASQLSLVSRAYYTDKLGPFLEKACKLSGQEMAVPMNTGAEAVETAIKAARKWAYDVKGVEKDKAEIIICKNNFHGRTVTIVSMSSEEGYKAGFGPLTPGFKLIEYNDVDALKNAINENTAAFIVEPIQGEAGIMVPDEGYLKACAEVCREQNVLLICDEVQTGLARTGQLFAYEYDGIKPDGLILGKALGGGVLAVSLFLSSREVLNCLSSGTHGSTFGGNPLSAAVGSCALGVIVDEKLAENAFELGQYFRDQLQAMNSPYFKTIRGKGLLIGVECDQSIAKTRDFCLKLMDLGLLSKETHETVVRFAPPLIITKAQIDEALAMIREGLKAIES